MYIVTVFLITALAIVNIPSGGCIKVFDTINKKDYCPTNTCNDPNSHLICKYYDPAKKIGDKCLKYRHLNINSTDVEIFVKRINGVRSQAANGSLRGYDGKMLPRAYSMNKMKWDSEMASFAQIQADQCTELIEFICAPTSRFPNTVFGLLLSPAGRTKTETFENYWNFFLRAGEFVLASSVEKSLDLTVSAYETFPLKMMQGAASRFGCGSAGYYSPHHGTYVTALVCMFEHITTQSEQLYATKPPLPVEEGFSSPCGCPMNYRETDGCLCEEIASEDDDQTISTTPAPIDNVTTSSNTPTTTESCGNGTDSKPNEEPPSAAAETDPSPEEPGEKPHLNTLFSEEMLSSLTANITQDKKELLRKIVKRSIYDVIDERLKEIMSASQYTVRPFLNSVLAEKQTQEMNDRIFNNVFRSRKSLGNQKILDSNEKIVMDYHKKILAETQDKDEKDRLTFYHPPNTANENHLKSLLQVVERRSNSNPAQIWY